MLRREAIVEGQITPQQNHPSHVYCQNVTAKIYFKQFVLIYTHTQIIKFSLYAKVIFLSVFV